ncbi:winged helix-turn-helix domain-containing protein [Alsobacter metallidurans]|nr:winged helix-turn-helix domain-containing protein [Alsobacter metallidurans]
MRARDAGAPQAESGCGVCRDGVCSPAMDELSDLPQDEELQQPDPVEAALRPVATLTATQARRIALAAQGFARPRPDEATRTHFDAMTARLGLLQIDSVNVLARAHHMPAYSRLGPYDVGMLDQAAYGGRRRKLFEYWGHEASLIRCEHQPLLRWRMARAERGEGTYTGIARYGREHPDAVKAVLREVEKRGRLAARDLGEERGAGTWWGWSDTKRALEWLFWAGLVTTATRRGNFERVYDLTERVLPRKALDAPTPSEPDAHRELLRIAARALGVATSQDLRDYFRLGPSASARLPELVEEGALLPVAVKGWKQPAYLSSDARKPRAVAAQAVVSPFDPLLWHRSRTERLFGVRYRIEIYTPAHKREHGYYVLPFLLGDRIVGRFDLKADRAAKRLIVQSAHLEAGQQPGPVAEAAADELHRLAAWLGLSTIEVKPKGDLAAHIAL